MSARYVIDASVGIAWVRADQATPETGKLLEKVESGERAVVPALWFAEVANSLLLQQRRHRLSTDELKLALETLASLNLVVDEEAAVSAFGQTSELAQEHGLTVYDATYLELALRLKLPLASRDGALRKAAKRCGVEVI